MAYEQLRDALRENLERTGVLTSLKAKILAEVFHSTHEPDDPRPPLCTENLLLNEAIIEYLDFAGYKNTVGVLMAEAGQPKERLQRDFVAQQLNLPALRCNAMERVGTDMPLLHGLFAREARQQQQRLRQSEACGPQQRAPCTAATTMPRPAISASCEVFESVARPSAGTMAQAPLPFRETGGQRIYSDEAGHAGSSAQLSSGISSAPLSIDSCGDAQSDKSHVPASSQQMASKDKEELRFSCEHQRPMPTPIIFTG